MMSYELERDIWVEVEAVDYSVFQVQRGEVLLRKSDTRPLDDLGFGLKSGEGYSGYAFEDLPLGEGTKLWACGLSHLPNARIVFG